MASKRLTTFIEILMIRVFQGILEMMAIKVLKTEILHTEIDAMFTDTNIKSKNWSL